MLTVRKQNKKKTNKQTNAGAYICFIQALQMSFKFLSWANSHLKSTRYNNYRMVWLLQCKHCFWTTEVDDGGGYDGDDDVDDET